MNAFKTMAYNEWDKVFAVCFAFLCGHMKSAGFLKCKKPGSMSINTFYNNVREMEKSNMANNVVPRNDCESDSENEREDVFD
jgi:hypothetical protein